MKKLWFIVLTVACVLLLVACGSQEPQDSEMCTLRWVFPGREADENAEEVYRRANEIIQETYPNIEVEFKMINLNDYENRLAMYEASKEKMDLVWGNDKIRPYYKYVYDEAQSLILDEPLRKHGKELMELFADMPGNILDDIRCNQRLYYLPNAPHGTGLIPYLKIPLEYKEYFDIPSLQRLLAEGNIGDEALYKIINDYLENVKGLDGAQSHIDYYSLIDILPRIGYKSVISTYELLGYPMDETIGTEIVSLKNTDAYLHFLDFARTWQSNGFIPEDIALLHENHTLYGGDYLLDADWGYFANGHFYSSLNDVYTDPAKYFYILLGDVFYTETAAPQGITYINLYTDYKEQAIQVLTLFYSKPELYRLLTYGIEGEDYTVENHRVTRTGYLTYADVFPHYQDEYYEIPDSNVVGSSVKYKTNRLEKACPMSQESFYWLDRIRRDIMYDERELRVNHAETVEFDEIVDRYIRKW